MKDIFKISLSDSSLYKLSGVEMMGDDEVIGATIINALFVQSLEPPPLLHRSRHERSQVLVHSSIDSS